MSSGVAWIDRKVGELRGARTHLEAIGMAPSHAAGDNPNCFYRSGRGWRVPLWSGEFSDDQLIDFAKERGFRPGVARVTGNG